MKYKKGYKIQVFEDEVYLLREKFRFDNPILTKYISLIDCVMVVKRGYASDGASGPTFDSKNTVRGAVGHDAIYQLMRMGEIPHHYWPYADKQLFQWLKQDGMSSFRIWIWKRGLSLAKGSAALPNE